MKAIIGLTGQSGAGKTTVSKAFEQSGFTVINCDMIARKVTEAGSLCCKKLSEIFPECFSNDLVLDRRKMAEIVFSDKDKLEKLNQTIYPFINDMIKEKLNEAEKLSEFALLDAPTLFEAGADKLCDRIVSVIADEKTRLMRIISRDGISEELAKKRFNSQHTTEFFRQHSDYVIENNGDLSAVTDKTAEVINNIKERYNGGKG